MKITNENITKHLLSISDKELKTLLWNGALSKKNEILCKKELENRHKKRDELDAPQQDKTSGIHKKKETTEPVINIHSLDPKRINETINDRGDTALIVAARSGDTHLIRRLLEMGSDPLIENDWGYTAKSIARKVRLDEAVQLLECAEKDIGKIEEVSMDDIRQEEPLKSYDVVRQKIEPGEFRAKNASLEVPEGMIAVEIYAERTGVSEEHVIEMIKEGKYVGRIVNGRWFVNEEGPTEHFANTVNTVAKKKTSVFENVKKFSPVLAILGTALFAMIFSSLGGQGAPDDPIMAGVLGGIIGMAVLIFRNISPPLVIIVAFVLLMGSLFGEFESFGVLGLVGWAFTGSVLIATVIMETIAILNETVFSND